jgi:sRNA-binding carbon storage regulator CsrA
MIRITRRVDEPLTIGSDLTLLPTDIDARLVRLLVKGRTMGGADDGLPLHKAIELAKGQSANLGPLVAVAVLDIVGDAVKLGVSAPPHVPVTGSPDPRERER